MSNKMLLTSSCMIFFHNSWLTSCKAMALCPVTSRHMIMCSSRITWNVERMGLLSSTLTNTHMKCGSTWLGAYISHSTWCHQQWKLIIDGYVRTTCRQDVGVEMQPDCSELTLQLLQLHQSFVCVFLRFLQVTCLHRVHHRDLDVLTKRKKEKTCWASVTQQTYIKPFYRVSFHQHLTRYTSTHICSLGSQWKRAAGLVGRISSSWRVEMVWIHCCSCFRHGFTLFTLKKTHT